MTSTSNASPPSLTCPECNVPNALSRSCLSKPVACFQCDKSICATCGGKFALIPFDRSNPNNDEANKLTKETATSRSYCKKCYEEVSTLDWTKTYDVVDASVKSSEAVVTLVMVHGGGGSRQMFRPHAETLSSEYGYKCVLLDLPGHGTLVDVPLTLDSCVDTVRKVHTECSLDPSRTIYVGASLGAYVGFYVLSKLVDKFAGAVLLDCGQNVGPDASIKAWAGLIVLRLVAQSMSNKALIDAMAGVALKSPANYKLIESTVGAGMFFQQGAAQVDCLRTVEPAACIPLLNFPILFFNGSEDYRDSENRWLSLCTNQTLSKLHVYDGGDHFFTHDSRFVSDMLSRIDAFVKSIRSG